MDATLHRYKGKKGEKSNTRMYYNVICICKVLHHLVSLWGKRSIMRVSGCLRLACFKALELCAFQPEHPEPIRSC